MFDPFAPMTFRIVSTVFMLIAIAMASLTLYDINNPPKLRRYLYGYTSHYSSTAYDYGSDSVKSPFALIITFNVIFLLVAAGWIYLKRKQVAEKKTNVPIVRPPSVAVAMDGLGFLLLMIMGIVAARGKFIKDICDLSPSGYSRTCGAAKAAAAFTFLASITILVCLMHSIADMRMETTRNRESNASDVEEGGHIHATAIMADESHTPSMETNYIQQTDMKAFAMPQQQQQMDMQEFMKMQQQFQQFQMQQQQMMMMQQQQMQQQQPYPVSAAGVGFDQTSSPVAEKTEQ